MKYKDFLTDIFRFPFHKKKFVFLISACLLMVSFTATAAKVSVQQTEAAEAKQLIKQAEKLTRRGELVEAENLLRGIIERSPENSAAKLALGYNLLKQRRLVEAYDLSIEVARAEPKNSRAFAVLGAALLSAGAGAFLHATPRTREVTTKDDASSLITNDSLGLFRWRVVRLREGSLF